MTETDNYIIFTLDDITVYETDIDILCDEYINGLIDPEKIYNTSVFSGMLNFIYKRLVKNIVSADKAKRNNNYNNYVLLDYLFDIYKSLCSKYSQCPTILQFCTEFVDIDNKHLTDVKQGTYRHDGSKVNPDSTRIVKKWFDTCESRLASRTLETNSIGSMFVLKSKYGWQEAKQQIEIVNGSGTQATPEQIAEKYADVAKPRLVDAESD